MFQFDIANKTRLRSLSPLARCACLRPLDQCCNNTLMANCGFFLPGVLLVGTDNLPQIFLPDTFLHLKKGRE